MREKLKKVGLICYVTFGAVMTLMWISAIAWGTYELALVLAPGLNMTVTWLTFAKATLAIVIVGLLLARRSPLLMIAVVAPFAVAELAYIYSRWSMSWEDYVLVFAILIAAGQVAWLGGVAVLFARRSPPPF